MPEFTLNETAPAIPVESSSEEEWRDILGFPGYQVSNLGRVRSRRSPGGWGLTSNWRILKPQDNNRGYDEIMFYFPGGGRKRKMVHHLVLEAFVGPRPPGTQARHVLTNNRKDNRLCNLCWGTPKENQGDRKRHGTQTRGEQCHAAKLKEEDIKEIFRLWREGFNRTEIGRRMGIRKENVFRILHKQHWAHASEGEYAEKGQQSQGEKGEKNPSAKLTEKQVLEMRRLYAEGKTFQEIAPLFGVTCSHVWRICTRRLWSHV